MSSEKKLHPAWLVTAGCCVWLAVMVGAFIASMAVFYLPLSESLNVPYTSVTLYTTVMTLARMVGLPIWGKLISKFKLKTLFLVGALMVCGSFGCMVFVQNVFQLYIIAAGVGLGSGLILYLSCPIMLGRWFKARLGTVIGFVMAFSGIGGIIFNPIGSKLVATVGFRQAALYLAVIGFIIVVLDILFLLKESPQACEAYGADTLAVNTTAATQAHKEELDGVSIGDTWKMPVFYLIVVMIAGLAFLSSMQTQLATFAVSIGIEKANSGFLVSVASFGMMIGSALLGTLNDKLGVRLATVTFSTVGILAGILGIYASATCNLTFAYIAAVCIGLSMTMVTVETPIMTRAVFGSKDYSQIYSRVMSVNSLMTAIAAFALGAIYTAFQNYKLAFGIVIAACVMMIVVINVVMAKTHQKNNTK